MRQEVFYILDKDDYSIRPLKQAYYLLRNFHGEGSDRTPDTSAAINSLFHSNRFTLGSLRMIVLEMQRVAARARKEGQMPRQPEVQEAIEQNASLLEDEAKNFWEWFNKGMSYQYPKPDETDR
jgi:hypothetical protein